MIPTTLKAITDYVVGVTLGERKGGTPRLIPPSLLAGPRGTGKSWILREIRNRIADQSDRTGIYPIEVPWSLSAETMIEAIQKGIEDARLRKTGTGLLAHDRQDRYLLLLEELDAFFTPKRIDAPIVRPKRTKGGGAALYSQMRNASRLRAFLIERHDTISVLATAGEDLRFLQDPDLPFFQFFNVINISPLDSDQTWAQLKSKTSSDWKFAPLLDSLAKLSPGFHHRLTEGKLLYINALVDSVWDLQSENINLNRPADDVVTHFLSLYFHRLDPYMAAIFENLSGLERQVVDSAVMLAEPFHASELRVPTILALKRTLVRLTEKRVIRREPGRSSKYFFTSIGMKSYLRFRRRLPLSTVIAPHLPT